MTTSTDERLAQARHSIRRRFGADALRTAADMHHATIMPTLIDELDAVLLHGGLPRGRLSVLRRGASVGMHSLAFHLIVAAQRQGGLVVYLDVPHTFDAEASVTAGVDPADLVLARPESSDEALAMLHALAATGEWGMVVVDSLTDLVTSPTAARRFDHALSRILPLVTRTSTIVLGLIDAQAPAARHLGAGSALAHAATLLLDIEHGGFVEQAGLFKAHAQVTGIRSRVTVAAQPGQRTAPSIELAFPLIGA